MTTGGVRDQLAAAAAAGPLPGSTTVGVVGRDVPVELIEAAGARPFRLRGDPSRELVEADRFLGRGLDPAIRSVLAGLLQSDFAGLSGIVVGSDTEASRRLFWLLREIRRVEPAIPVPPVHLVDVMHMNQPAGLTYTAARLAEFRGVLSEWTGSEIRDGALAESIAEQDQLRVWLLRLSARRRGLRPTHRGSDFLLARLAAARLLSAESIPLVRALIEEPATGDGATMRVVLTGSDHDELSVTRAIEDAGVRIVADDHPGGELGIDVLSSDSGASGIQALAARYAADGMTPHRGRVAPRGAHTAMLAARSGADGILSYVRVCDEAPLWDFAAQERASRLPLGLLRDQDYAQLGDDALRVALARIGMGND